MAGKDNLRQQAAMWQAMLLSAELPPSRKILINGFIGVNGQKMSKSLGNVIAPKDLVTRYGRDASRFLLAQLGPIGEDMDVSMEKFDIAYQSFLANGIGNLCSRIAKLAETVALDVSDYQASLLPEFAAAMEKYDLRAALEIIKIAVATLDKKLAEEKPWLLTGQEKIDALRSSSEELLDLALSLQIFLPETSRKIQQHFSSNPVSSFETGLFPRLTSL